MLKNFLTFFAAAFVLFALSALNQAQEINSPVGAKHVIWIGSDGFGAHYVNWDELPNMKKNEGKRRVDAPYAQLFAVVVRN